MTSLQILGLIVGFISGAAWEKLSTSPFNQFSSLIPSLFVKGGSTTFHLHHWLLYALVFLITLVWSYKTGRLAHPAVLFLLAFFGGAILLNFYHFKDEFIFISGGLKKISKKK